MHTRTLFAAITILLLFISASFAIVLAEGPPPGVDTAQRDDVVPEDDGGGASGAVDEGSERRLPDVDNAQRDDVVEEEEGATGSAANAPAPTGLTVTSDTDDSVSLSWNTVTNAGAYKVEYRRSGSISWLHAGYVYSSTSDTVEGLECNTSYDFRVRARGDGSPYSYTYGNPSSSVSETTAAVVSDTLASSARIFPREQPARPLPLHLQVQILVLRLSHRDPGVTVERHPAAPLAGMGKSIPACQGEINRVFQPPPELRQGGILSRGRKQGCFQPCTPGAGGLMKLWTGWSEDS